MYWQCTYLGFGLLEAPREYVLHGPLLAMYWLRLCPHSWERALEAMLVERRLFIFLMTAAHISPNVFSLRVFLANVQWTSHYNIRQWHTFILYITLYVHSHPHIIHHIHMYIHVFISSFLLLFMAGWLPSTLCVRYSFFAYIARISLLYFVHGRCFADPFFNLLRVYLHIAPIMYFHHGIVLRTVATIWYFFSDAPTSFQDSAVQICAFF